MFSRGLANKPERAALAQDSMLLGANPALYLLRFGGGVALTTVGMFSGFMFLPQISALYALMTIPIGLLSYGALRWSVALWTKRECAWLRRLPFTFEAERLLTILGTHSAHCRLTLTVELAEPTEYRQQMKTPSLLARFTRRATSKSMTYEIVSPSFRTVRVTVNKQGQAKHDNSDVYAWFKSVALKVLLPLHNEWPIESVTIQADRG